MASLSYFHDRPRLGEAIQPIWLPRNRSSPTTFQLGHAGEVVEVKAGTPAPFGPRGFATATAGAQKQIDQISRCPPPSRDHRHDRRLRQRDTPGASVVEITAKVGNSGRLFRRDSPRDR